MGEGFAGVDLNTLGESTPEISEPKGEESSSSGADPITGQEARQSQTTDIPDLDKLERFRFNGRELSRKELTESFMRRDDYSRKTAELAETRKYADNFDADMRHVLANPELLAELEKIYPAGYVQIAKSILSHRQQQPGHQQQSPEKTMAELPPEVMAKLDKIDRWEKEMQERSTQATLEQLDTLHTRLGEKFQFADPDVVDRRIELAIDNGLKITPENIAQIFENAYKMHNDTHKGRIDALTKKKVEDQVKAGKSARDVGAGGSLPGTAPKKFKNFAEINKGFFGADR